MSYTVNDQRRQTMIARLGEAVDLIDNQAFLPFYRSIQIKLEKKGKPEEWGKMIALAKTKEHASRYFAKLCKMVKDNTYVFVTKVKTAVKEVSKSTALYLHDKLVKFGFGKYQKYWVQKASEFVDQNGMAGFAELLEYAERKGISQKYMATALKNGQAPSKYYKLNLAGKAKA